MRKEGKEEGAPMHMPGVGGAFGWGERERKREREREGEREREKARLCVRRRRKNIKREQGKRRKYTHTYKTSQDCKEEYA